jgi:hypothetical protein
VAAAAPGKGAVDSLLDRVELLLGELEGFEVRGGGGAGERARVADDGAGADGGGARAGVEGRAGREVVVRAFLFIY